MATEYTLENINVMQGLTDQWRKGQFCGAKLKVEGKIITAHKCVLSAASEYFRSMYLGDYIESTKDEIEIKGITYAAMQIITESIYTQKLNLTDKCVVEVFSAAHFLQMKEIADRCEEHMISKMTAQNCFQFLKVFEKLNMEKRLGESHDFIVRNFDDIWKDKNFVEVSQEALFSYLTDENLQPENEMNVFRAAKAWIEHDRKRLKFADGIMCLIRFAFIPPDLLTGEVMKVPFARENAKYMTLVFEALNYQKELS